MCWNAAVLCRLREARFARRAAAVAAVLVLAVAGPACGGDDSETDGGAGNAGGEKLNPRKELERQDAYNTAFKQCKRIGVQPLRAAYGKNPPDLLAQVYVTQNAAYFEPYEQEAIRGCAVGLSR
jgi:hypothetical protein